MTSFHSTNELDEERRRKMQAVHTELEPSAREIVQRLQIIRSRRAFEGVRLRKVTLPAFLGVAFGLLLSGSAFAWAVATGHVQISSPPVVVEQSSIPVERPRLSDTHIPRTKLTVDTEDTPVEQAVSTNSIEQLARPSPPPHHTIARRTSAVGLERRNSENSSWADVVEKLRRGQAMQAQTDLENLEKSQDQGTREAARLLRLQLQEERQGLSEQELLDLSQLSETALANSVRASAQRLRQKVTLPQSRAPD